MTLCDTNIVNDNEHRMASLWQLNFLYMYFEL